MAIEIEGYIGRGHFNDDLRPLLRQLRHGKLCHLLGMRMVVRVRVDQRDVLIRARSILVAEKKKKNIKTTKETGNSVESISLHFRRISNPWSRGRDYRVIVEHYRTSREFDYLISLSLSLSLNRRYVQSTTKRIRRKKTAFMKVHVVSIIQIHTRNSH